MTREEIVNEIKCILSELNNGEDAVSYLTQNDVKWLNENIKALEQESCDDIVNRKLEELFERVENIEKQIKEDKEVQLKKLKAEVDYAKFRCTL